MTDTPLRLAQVLAGAENGGAENFFVRLTCGLNGVSGISEKAFIRNHGHRIDTLRKRGVDTEGFRFGGKLDFIDNWRFRNHLKRWQPDVVMTWMGRASQATPPGDYVLVNRLGHYYNLKYYQKADYWVGITKGICQHLIDGGMPAERVVHIPNFADEREVTPLPRDSFDTPADKPLLLAAGRLHENKGFDILLRALVQIPDATLWLAGAGPEAANLKTLCHELGLESRVRFLGWRNDVTALMRTVDVFVCPSRHEGLGSIVLESWFSRCPIVATASQGPAELIADGVTGLVTPIDEPAPLAEAVSRVLADINFRQQLTSNGAREYNEKYSEAVIVEAYRQFFQRIRKT